MTAVNTAFDFLARLPDEAGMKVRAVCLIPNLDAPPAELVLVREDEGQLVEHRRDLVESIIERSQLMWTINLVDGSRYSLESLGGCGCGGGRLKIQDPLPGVERQAIRTPIWLKVSA